MRKRWTLLPADEAVVSHLQQVLKINPIFCRLLAQRGISTYDGAKTFFRPEWSHLHDPFLMKGMEAAVACLQRALQADEKILLYGDYDVDGTTSVALMYQFLSGHRAKLDFYIPNRYREGYGVSMAGIDHAIAEGTKLIIAMDCGVNAREQVAKAKSHGIDFIICDHHLPDGSLPDAIAVLDPMRPDCPYPFKGLSGCGVAFKLAQAFLQKNNLPDTELHPLLDLLVLSIAADIVPMIGENRVLAHLGLQYLNRSSRPGISALLELSGRQRPLSISDLVFGLAPLINAAGRLADADQAVKLLLSADKTVAADNARVLLLRNQLRKEHDQQIQDEAIRLFDAKPDKDARRSVVLFQPDWHKGVIGIAAARMVERFHRPAILLTESNGMAVGSARTVPGFNIYEAIKTCEDLLTNFGGHAHAAGLTMPLDAVPVFQERFEEVVRNSITEEQQVPEVEVSATLDLNEITPGFWRILKQFAPFGPGNRSPVFVTKKVMDTGYSKLLKGTHLRLSLKQAGAPTAIGMAFGMGEHFARISSKKPFHVAYKIEEEQWQGKAYLRLMVKDFWF
ncbi:MAG: single-stranded-DNA-specific exonuclease RecJ [Saprospiraceae bacterium]|nr:single-stranded-DNA-specific exonuclease RecJ [Saprospiraceae bacterium]MCF8251260.1 single-stranded-DNA-specific exonuclease RecJ [Saprospiraceae bacterium]MCF8311797.1 single-stranded-DNA-specific exonuclease RecJ [Saprospiraceae bacterium]MCF8441938.1 single-stranded-DNA-specific exonuclease RecJ [Saprospiraceae bacterium]